MLGLQFQLHVSKTWKHWAASGKNLQVHSLTEALGQVGLLVDEDLGGDDGAEGLEGGDQVRVGELLRQVVDEEVVGALPARPRALLHAAAVRGLQLAACNIAGLDT